MAFNFELMEEELTCPVCLDLYKDPLMLPCSHSLCKKCLREIIGKNGSINVSTISCPSCRTAINITLETLPHLPKNLVLENIVARYSEEKIKIARRSLMLESWPFSETPRASGSPCVSSGGSSAVCDLCDPASAAGKATLACIQCDVAYCHSCFLKYHPNRGALARHKIKTAPASTKLRHSLHIQSHMFFNKTNASASNNNKTSSTTNNNDSDGDALLCLVAATVGTNCPDHKSEPSTMFCDRCKMIVCHMCVCDGEGRHAGHKMLTLETAATSTVNLANQTKEQCNSIISMLRENQLKINVFSSEIKDLHKSACSRIEQQFRRFIEDLMGAVEEEKKLTLKKMDEARGRLARRTESHKMESEKFVISLGEVASSCTMVIGESGSGVGGLVNPADVLSRAVQLQPVVGRFKKSRKEVSLLQKRCNNMFKDKSSRLLFLSGTEQFRKRVDKLLTWFLDDGLSGGDTIVPKVSTSPAPMANCTASMETGPLCRPTEVFPTVVHRLFKQSNVVSRCLTTWGGDVNTVTTYTGDPVQRQCSWTITVEQNISSSPIDNHLISSASPNNFVSPFTSTSSYIFGAGISDDPLSMRDLVGMTTSSRGIICVGGLVYYCGKCEPQQQQQSQDSPSLKPAFTFLTKLESLPVSLTLALKIDSPEVTILSYKLTSSAPDGRRVLSLVGRKIIRDLVPGSRIYPVFTVTPKVKILFPTYV